MSRSFKQHHTPKQQRTIYSRKEWLAMLRCLREKPWEPGEPLSFVAHRLDLACMGAQQDDRYRFQRRLWHVDMATALKVITALGQDVPRGKKKRKVRPVSRRPSSPQDMGDILPSRFPRIAQ